MNNLCKTHRPSLSQVFSVVKNNVRTAAGFVRQMAIGRCNSQYTLSFVDDGGGCWYIDLPSWKGSRNQLAMVAGADRFLTHMAEDRQRITLDVRVFEKPLSLSGYVCLRRTRQDYGAWYAYDRQQAVLQGYPCFMDGTHPATAWLCPVTLFVMGRYPGYIYVKRVN